jgi:predicted RNA-binding Zn ribbon-like protein
VDSPELVRDFVNTVDLEDAVERLATPADLASWLFEHGLAPRGVRVSEDDRRHAVEVREALRELLLANNGEPADVAAAGRVLDRAARRSSLAVRFDPDCRFVPAREGIGGALGRILAVVADSMAHGTWERLKACRSETCRWAFYDRAPNRSRQWCSMRVCGNREKARVYRRRHVSLV